MVRENKWNSAGTSYKYRYQGTQVQLHASRENFSH